MKKSLLFLVLLIGLSLTGKAQMIEPVHFETLLKTTDKGEEAEIVFNATIDDGWHLYSTDLGSDGPIAASFHVNKMEGAVTVGKLQPRGKVVEEYDEMFGMKLRFFEHKGTFVQKIKFTKRDYLIDCYIEYGACNNENCLPPTQVAFFKKGVANISKAQQEEAEEKAEEMVAEEMVTDTAQAPTDSIAATTTATIGQELWSPVIDELKAYDEKQAQDSSLIYIFMAGLVGGFLALLTPCVWPIIPMTVSFFLKRNKEKKKAVREAVTYGVSIVVIYVLLGLVVTMLFGASALNALSTNALFNIFFCLLLVVFAASFFGAFELTLPSSWSNKIDQKSENTTGLLSIFLMAFTLTLVSFSCTGPIIGFLLVAVSTQGSILSPTVGMLGFAVALAIPFTLFAMFPTLLKSAPKSGGWMNVIKVVLGFIELAFALKFLSVADLAYGWHILDRETFLALWIAIFFLLGLYLIGKLKFQSDVMLGEPKPMPVPCVMLGLVSLAFAVYMIPGLWGAPCKAVSAFAPPMNTQDFNLNTNEVKPKYTSYEEGVAAAAAQGKPILIDFTGFGCVNCRKMEAAVWTDPRVADKLNNDYVLISLYVDDKQPLAKPIEVTVNGQKRTLRTVGDKWSYLQQSKFGALAQPYYVTLGPDGMPLSRPFSFKEDVSDYLNFLQEGLDNYRSKQND